MKIKNTLLAGFFLTAIHASATVTINFNNPFAGGVSSNLADTLGNVSNGLYWGVIVDTDSSGFLTSYDDFTLAQNTTLILGSGGAPTTNVLILADSFTTDTSAFLEGDVVTTGGNGGVTAITDTPLANGVTTGDAFRLVWFDPSGTEAGFLSDPSFLIPTDGASGDFDSPFVGTDPVRAATGITIVPEPSALLLSAFGVLGLLRRKR